MGRPRWPESFCAVVLCFRQPDGGQRDRNEFLKQEIAELDKQIEEILELETRKSRLLARMDIIEQLQRSRPGIVHVFDDMVNVMPEGVFLSSVKQTGRRVEMVGVAESNTRVSALMRNIDKSEWLTNPDLEVVEVKTMVAAGKPARGQRIHRVCPHRRAGG